MKKSDDKVTLEFTPHQQQELTQKCGFNSQPVVTDALSLVMLSMAATAAKSDVLPLVGQLSTAKLFLEKATSHGQHYFITLDLTTEQREIIKTIVKKDWLQVALYPDENNVAYKEEWLDNASTQRGGKSFIILAQNSDYSPSATDLVIKLPLDDDETRTSTFGKGRHPTTQIMLYLMEKYLKAGANVLDVGTGSGILAIAAMRLGAAKVLAIDVDSNAVNTTKKSVKLNNFDDKVRVNLGSLEVADDIYDVVLANLFPKIIIPLAGDMFNKVASGGTLFVSGVVNARVAGIISVLEAVGFEHKKTIGVDIWSGLVFAKT